MIIKRYLIYGAGSLGTVLGAYISKNGGNIELVNRNKKYMGESKPELANIEEFRKYL